METIYLSLSAQVAVGTFFMKSPLAYCLTYKSLICNFHEERKYFPFFPRHYIYIYIYRQIDRYLADRQIDIDRQIEIVRQINRYMYRQINTGSVSPSSGECEKNTKRFYVPFSILIHLSCFQPNLMFVLYTLNVLVEGRTHCTIIIRPQQNPQ